MVDLNKVKDDPEAQLAGLTSAIKASKNNADLYARRAIVYLKQREFEKALSDADQAVKLSKDQTEHLFVKAQVLRALKSEGEALKLALQAERKGYQNVMLYVLLSDLYFQLKQFDKAKKYNKLAIKTAPSNEYVLYYNGRIAAATGDTAVAVNAYRKALQTEPEFFELKRELAGLYVAGKDFEQGQLYLEQAQKLDSTDGLLWYYQGKIYQSTERTDSAVWSYNKAVSLADTLTGAHHQLGYIHFARGNYNLAAAHLEKAADRYGKTVRFLTTFATSYEHLGEDRKALEQYEKLVSLEPKYSYAYQKIARLKSRLATTVNDSTIVVPED